MGCCMSGRNSDATADSEIEISFNSLHKDKKGGEKGKNGKRRKGQKDDEPILNQCQLGLKSQNLKILPNSTELTGSGTILGSCPLDCDTGRWEVHIVKGITSTDQLQVGIKRFYKHVSPDNLLVTLEQGNEAKNNETIAYYLSDSKLTLKENDVIGVYWDQTDLPMLQFSLNGELLFSVSVNRIRPSNDMYVAVSLDGSKTSNGVFKIVFNEDEFKYPTIANKFKMIICSTKLI
mmetsp:Transcript_30039/g.32729  ORF Transcript_30039/g.32729 Transcript_30039/m.32729 type:complete len:234 (-) Transcript_30039:274-975(-)